MNEAQKMKRNFRASKAWKAMRHAKKVEQSGRCYITGTKLTRTAKLHHMDLNPAHYKDMSNPNMFRYLSHTAHETVHWIYHLLDCGQSAIWRLLNVIASMVKINQGEEAHDGFVASIRQWCSVQMSEVNG